MVSGDLASFWLLINTLQVLSLMIFLNITTSPILEGFLSGLLNDSKIPNLYAYIGNSHDNSEMPSRFITFRYSYPSFLDITGHVITMWIVIGILFGLALITLLFKHPKVNKIGIMAKDKMMYNGVI